MTIGRIVLFCLPNGELRPAIVTRVHGQELVDLYVIPTHDDLDYNRVPHLVPMWNPIDVNESPAPGTWRWPPRG